MRVRVWMVRGADVDNLFFFFVLFRPLDQGGPIVFRNHTQKSKPRDSRLVRFFPQNIVCEIDSTTGAEREYHNDENLRLLTVRACANPGGA